MGYLMGLSKEEVVEKIAKRMFDESYIGAKAGSSWDRTSDWVKEEFRDKAKEIYSLVVINLNEEKQNPRKPSTRGQAKLVGKGS